MARSGEFQAGPEDAIAKAIMELISLTQRPPSKDDIKEAPYVEGLCRMAWDYPIDVVENACRQWRRIPERGRWWPEEQDLRVQCEALLKPRKDLRDEAVNLLRFMERREHAQGVRDGHRSPNPSGATLAFVEAVLAARGPAYVRSFLSYRTCDFTETTIFTLGYSAEDRLPRDCAPILRQHKNVRLLACPEVTKRVYAEVDASGVTFTAPSKKQKKKHREWAD